MSPLKPTIPRARENIFSGHDEIYQIYAEKIIHKWWGFSQHAMSAMCAWCLIFLQGRLSEAFHFPGSRCFRVFVGGVLGTTRLSNAMCMCKYVQISICIYIYEYIQYIYLYVLNTYIRIFTSLYLYSRTTRLFRSKNMKHEAPEQREFNESLGLKALTKHDHVEPTMSNQLDDCWFITR